MRIVGEVFDPGNCRLAMLTDWQTLASADRGLTPTAYDVALRPGTSPAAYASALSTALGRNYPVSVNANDLFILTLIGLIGTLTLLLAAVAGLGVLNTVVAGRGPGFPQPAVDGGDRVVGGVEAHCQDLGSGWPACSPAATKVRANARRSPTSKSGSSMAAK